MDTEITGSLLVNAIMLGVRDLGRARKFYGGYSGCFSDPDGHLRKVAASA